MRRALTVVALAAVAFPVTAAADVRITNVDRTAYPELRVTVVTSAASVKAPLVREADRPVLGATAVNLGSGANVVLALDRSRSMQGTALSDAVAAARGFVAGKRHDTNVEVVAFGRRALELTGFGTSPTDADQALATLDVDRREGTALYDAVAVAAHALRAQEDGARVLVVLTDGKDTSSRTSLEAALAAARRAGVVVFPIGIESDQFSPAPLRRLASETGGAYHAATSTSSLAGVYRDVARQLARTWRVEYPTVARPGDTRTIDASVPGLGAARASFSIPGTLGDAPARVEPSPAIPGVVYGNGIGALVVMLFSGLAALLAVGVLLGSTAGRRLKKRIDPHVGERAAKGKSSARDRLTAADGLLSATEKAFARFSLFPKLQRILDRADLPLRPVELFYVCFACAFVPAFILAFAGAPSLVLLLTMGIGGVLPVAVVAFKAKRRLVQIDTALPDLLITLAASLKAGHSFRQGIQAATEEDAGPLTRELKRVLTETSLGRPMDDALQEMADRVGSNDLEFVITAVTIQRQVGGSLAGIFDLVADTIRQRQQFARKIRSLTAMGRMSAYVLIGLPLFLAVALTVMNSSYMAPLWSTPTGHELIMLGVVMMGFGSLILRKIVNFRG